VGIDNKLTKSEMQIVQVQLMFNGIHALKVRAENPATAQGQLLAENSTSAFSSGNYNQKLISFEDASSTKSQIRSPRIML